MRRPVEFGLLILLLALAAVILGCSQDKNPGTGNPSPSSSDPDDPRLLGMYESLGDAQSLSRTLLNSTWMTLDSILATEPETDSSSEGRRRRHGGGLSVDVDSLFLEYHEGSAFWWYTLVSVDSVDGGAITQIIVDSLQFIAEQGPVQWPGKHELLGLACGGRVSIVYPDADSVAATDDLMIEGAYLDGEDVTISGLRAFLFDLNREGDSSIVHFDMVSTVNDMSISSYPTYGESCPASGSVQYDGEFAIYSYGSRALSFSDMWGVRQYFIGDSQAHYEVFNTTDRWTFVGTCY